jgi:uncharacterized protein (TIGR01777 family)
MSAGPPIEEPGRVLITGGSGLIGSALARDLGQSGREVVVLSRDPEALDVQPIGVRAVRWDARTADGWGELADGAEAIVNLAGESIGAGRWTAERKERIRQSRVAAGEAVVAAIAAARRKPGVLVQASAVGFYGPRGDELVTEETPPGNDFLAHTCVAWEASTAPVESQGVRRVVARTGVVLSRSGGALPRMLTPYRWFVGGRLGSGRQWMPWIHIADEVGALRFLIERPDARGPFNLSAPAPLTNSRFGRALGRAMRRPSLMPAPAFALRRLLGEMSQIVLEGQRAVPERLLALGYSFQFPEAKPALEILVR